MPKLILLIFFVNSYLISQDKLYEVLDIPYYYTDLPYQFWNASNVKKQKLKNETVKILLDKDSPRSYYPERKTDYDTNGIPISMLSLDTHKYYNAYHMTDDFLVDSTVYKLDSLARLKERTLYFRTKYTERYEYTYDENGRCNMCRQYFKDSLFDTDFYNYDSKGRIISNGDDERYVAFIFNENGISEIYFQEGKNKFIDTKYLYNKRENTRSEIDVRHKDKLKAKLYFNEDGSIAMEEKFFSNSNYRKYNKIRAVYGYNKSGLNIKKVIYELSGNNILNFWTYKFSYNSHKMISEEKIYNNKGNFVRHTVFQYEFYN